MSIFLNLPDAELFKLHDDLANAIAKIEEAEEHHEAKMTYHRNWQRWCETSRVHMEKTLEDLLSYPAVKRHAEATATTENTENT